MIPRFNLSLFIFYLGKLFNQHPQVFYMEQPLYPFEMFKNLNYTRDSEYSGQVRAFMDNLFHCRFHGYKDYLTFLSHPGLASPQYRLASKALSSPPLCKQEVASYTNRFLEQCPLLHPKWVSNVCAGKMHVVVSILNTRAPTGGLSGLLPLMTSESMAMRVLYLVRDPRASVWKMLGANERGNIGKSGEEKIEKFCAKLERDVDFSESLPWEIRKQYHVVRYEEVLRNISSASQKVFKFAGIHQETSVKNFVKEQEQKLTNFDQEVSWRISISKGIVSMVERHCARVMRTLGYKILNDDENNLIRNLDYSLLTQPQESYVIKK